MFGLYLVESFESALDRVCKNTNKNKCKILLSLLRFSSWIKIHTFISEPTFVINYYTLFYLQFIPTQDFVGIILLQYNYTFVKKKLLRKMSLEAIRFFLYFFQCFD